MNKKKLSVVMAGAMLASSVAPVLAAEVQKSEMSADNLGLVIKTVREKLNSVKFEDVVRNKEARGKSIYFVKIDGDTKTLDVNSTQADYQRELGNLKPGTKVEIWTKAHTVETVDGVDKYYAYEEVAPTYTASDLQTLSTTIGTNTVNDPYKNIVTKTELKGTTAGTSADTTLVITFNNTSATWLPATKTLEVGDVKLDETKYIDRLTKEPKDMPGTGSLTATEFDGFPEAEKDKVAVADGKAKVEEITITSGGNNLSVEDIYDGLMLTTKGHDFFASIAEAEELRATKRELTGNAKGGTATITAGGTITTTRTNIDAAIVEINGEYSFTITVPQKADASISEVKFTVTGKNEKDTERMAEWILNEQAKVDIFAGSNRYATAVKIAEGYAGLTDATVSHSGQDANIVLVNGDSLVDGLAASPLAAALSTGTYKAPVLLTESDRLPKETRAYLKEVIGNLQINDVKKATIHIVGGEAVVSKGLERELKSLGFSVERYGGDNREATSLEVADKIVDLQNGTGTATKEAFVVGANGEADAMSIAAVASNKTANSQTPIIVAKNGGISEDALYELRGKKVVIVGGESSVSKAEEEEIGLEAEKVSRIGGANRQETNAEVISKYYVNKFGTAQNVIVAKDGRGKKSELIDALAAANFASQKQAPIVLATNKLTDSQVNALELNAKEAEALFQVGIGVDKDNVVKVIAQRLGLAN